jgi:hypothetical protein
MENRGMKSERSTRTGGAFTLHPMSAVKSGCRFETRFGRPAGNAGAIAGIVTILRRSRTGRRLVRQRYVVFAGS